MGDVIFPRGLDEPTRWQAEHQKHLMGQREAKKTLGELMAARRRDDKAIEEAEYKEAKEGLAAEWCRIHLVMGSEEMDASTKKNHEDRLKDLLKEAEVLDKEKNNPKEDEQKAHKEKLNEENNAKN